MTKSRFMPKPRSSVARTAPPAVGRIATTTPRIMAEHWLDGAIKSVSSLSHNSRELACGSIIPVWRGTPPTQPIWGG